MEVQLLEILTVLVEEESGLLYSDGHRYKAYYVPLRLLEVADSGPD